MKSSPSLLFGFMLSLCLPFFSALTAESTGVDQEIKKATLVQVGQEAPDFTCETTNGKTLTLSALKGKVVVLYFFSTAALPASVAEMRYLETDIFQHLQARDDFQVIALGRGHTREELVKIGGERKLTFPMAPDPQQEIFKRYFTKFVPRMVVVRRDGTILALSNGSHEFEGIARLQAVLAGELAKAR